MATHCSFRSVAPLFAVTLLTSTCAIIPGESRPSEPPAQLAIDGELPGIDGRRWVIPFSADTFAEARWVRLQREYALDGTGRAVPSERRVEAATADKVLAFADRSKSDHFDRIFSGEPMASVAECGPSPATPDDITRLVVEAAQRHGVDVSFAVAVAIAESRLDRLRNSPKGARGPMQLMPQTAERLGVTDICHPAENIDGGVRYLRQLMDEFRNPLLVAAAYNAGELRVRAYGGIPPFKETVGYVAEVLNIQMQLEGSGSVARQAYGSADAQQRRSNSSGIITSRDRRRWVGGVMHF